MARRLPVPPKILTAALDELEEFVPAEVKRASSPLEAYAQIIKLMHDIFEKTREDDLVAHTHRPWYLGIYEVNPDNPLEIRTLPWRGPSEACSPIKLERGGVIWKAVQTGEVQYVPDVESQEAADPTSHVNCTAGSSESEKMRGAEIVIPLYGGAYSTGAHANQRSVIGGWDLDLNIKRLYGDEDAGTNSYVERLDRILREPGERILTAINGETPFEPQQHIHMKPMEGKAKKVGGTPIKIDARSPMSRRWMNRSSAYRKS